MSFTFRLRALFLLVIVCVITPVFHAKKIEDCCCEAETIDVGNADELYAKLQELRKSVFFRTFKVNLHSPCPYWQDENEQCSRKGCAVCGECGPDDLPPPWRIETTDPVDTTISKNFQGWDESDHPLWIVQDSQHHISYININLNPESFTGYDGPAARRIWAAIFDENCFTGSFTDMCYEQRVFYRLMSGLRASISCHIASQYPVGDSINDIYSDTSVMGPNYEVYADKVGDHQDRINNLYFAYVFMLRAVNKAAPILRSFDYSTGSDVEDRLVTQQIRDILGSKLIQQCLPHSSFDESTMFNTPTSHHLKRQFKSHFRNISRIMDCVGCEKCKLHGKLQILGIGTALRILFEDGQNLALQRNEVMALIVTLAKFSNAIKVTHDMRSLKYRNNVLLYIVLFVGAFMLLSVCYLCIRVCLMLRRRRHALRVRASKKNS